MFISLIFDFDVYTRGTLEPIPEGGAVRIKIANLRKNRKTFETYGVKTFRTTRYLFGGGELIVFDIPIFVT